MTMTCLIWQMIRWDVLLDDDELEQDRKMRQDKKTQGDASKKQDKRRRGLFGGLFG